MSLFYLLPSRASVAEHFAGYLEAWFPGVGGVAPELADQLVATALGRTDGFAVFADELPDGDDLVAALRESYGAEPGDWVVDLRGGPKPPDGGRAGRGPAGDHKFPARLAPAC
jgi:hypothetical protein